MTNRAALLPPTPEQLTDELVRLGFARDDAILLKQHPMASPYRIECAIASAFLKQLPTADKRRDHVQSFITRGWKLTEPVALKVRDMRHTRSLARPKPPAARTARTSRPTPSPPPPRPTPPASDASYFRDLRQWREGKTADQLERLRDELLASSPDLETFTLERLRSKRLGRTELTLLMEFERRQGKEAA